jgi:Bacterial alpha-L-rhamnosidase 6 hairpin glycosidase domain
MNSKAYVFWILGILISLSSTEKSICKSDYFKIFSDQSNETNTVIMNQSELICYNENIDSSANKILYKSDKFTVYSNKVIQDDNEAVVLSPTKIRSNYKSKESENYSRRIQFKLSINEKDNEFPSGKDHWLIIGDEHESSIITFGQRKDEVPEEPSEKLPPNYQYTFRVDMSPVLDQFTEKGFFETFDGSRIAKEDFKNVYLASGSGPMTWDFSNLEENELALKDLDGDGIYELKVVLNPYNPKDYLDKTWELSPDISSKPSYRSEQPIVDALFNMSLEEALMNIEADSTLRTGAKWSGVWTRDVSYSILLAFAYHEPEVAKISLLKKVKRDRIIQDTGSGGAYPVSSDRTTWSLAAWEIYKTTGDMDWLRKVYNIIKNTLDDDYQNLKSETGMYRGESSFLDWREQTYPKWMNNKDIYISENLGTNVVHYQAHKILAKMAKILSEPFEVYEQRSESLKTAINKQLWMEDKGYYGQYLYGRVYHNLSPRFEALGEALAILFDVADEKQASSIIENSPVTEFGTTCIFPQIPGIPPYHNNGIWPFVQSYWNMAAAKAGNEKALLHGLASIYRAGALFLTNYENFVADNGDFMGTEINSHRMLWSMAGNLAMVHRIFMGINFEENGIRFKPVIPRNYGGSKTLDNFKYRDAVLKIKVEGYGNCVDAFYIDGEQKTDAFLFSDLSGTHEILIKMANNDFSTGSINLIGNKFTLPNPIINYNNKQLTWEEVEGAASYNVYKNGELFKNVQSTSIHIVQNEFEEYKVSVVDSEGTESFTSNPVIVTNTAEELTYQFEDWVQKSDLPYTNYMGNGFIETSCSTNEYAQIDVFVEKEGTYLIDLRYSNGSGPWNTDNNCAMRTLYINDEQIGSMVLPQRGTDEWSDWGYSNSYKVKLNKGNNLVKLKLEDWNTNMDGEINLAMLDYLRLIFVN